jgi:cytoskeleton protein RodZ
MDRIKLQDSDGAERPATGPSDVGARLRAAREAKQITLREIAATTKISVSALEAVEQNDVTRLPGGIFTRAFVRAYANEVGLDAEETMRDYIEQVPPETVKEASRADLLADGYDEFKSQRRMAGTAMTLLVVGIPLAGGLLYLGTRDFTAVDEAAGRVVETQPAAVNESLAASESTVVALPVAGANESDDQDAVAELLSLVLQPTDDCWVSLTIDGVLIFSRVMQGGERESYQAGDEIVINIGDAGAFEFTINQRPGRSLGAPGEVVTARITHQNVGSFLVP